MRPRYPSNLTCPMPPTPSNEPFTVLEPHGWWICRKIIVDKLPKFGPHDYQLEGITELLPEFLLISDGIRRDQVDFTTMGDYRASGQCWKSQPKSVIVNKNSRLMT